MLPLSGALGSNSAAVSARHELRWLLQSCRDVVSFYLGFRASTYVIKGQAGIRWTGLFKASSYGRSHCKFFAPPSAHTSHHR